jgi:hypothetical protein
MHDQWKNAKTQAKHLDMSVFNKKLGETLDKYETEFEKLYAKHKPVIEGKKTQTKDERSDLVELFKALPAAAVKLVNEYTKAAVKLGKEITKRKSAAKSPADKKRAEAEEKELRVIVELLSNYHHVLIRRGMEIATNMPDGT